MRDFTNTGDRWTRTGEVEAIADFDQKPHAVACSGINGVHRMGVRLASQRDTATLQDGLETRGVTCFAVGSTGSISPPAVAGWRSGGRRSGTTSTGRRLTAAEQGKARELSLLVEASP